MQPLWETVWKFLKKLKTELPYDSAIPLLAIYLKKMKPLIQEGIYNSMLIAAAFVVVKLWMQPKCPSTDVRVEKMSCVCTYTWNGISLSYKNE